MFRLIYIILAVFAYKVTSQGYDYEYTPSKMNSEPMFYDHFDYFTCNEPCPMSPDPFCEIFRNPSTCQCETACCELPYCEFGYADCTSCGHCHCNLLPTSQNPNPCDEPCPLPDDRFCEVYRDYSTCECITVCNMPSPTLNLCDAPCAPLTDPFCESYRDPSTCRCETVCCSPPYCEFGYAECTSCQNCHCNMPPTSSFPNPCDEPCPSSDEPFCESYRDHSTCECVTVCNFPLSTPYLCDEPCPSMTDPFCESYRDPTTCQCETVCCSVEPCEFGYAECTSCYNCRCNPPPSFPDRCDEPCSLSVDPFCEAYRDPSTCECVAECNPPPFSLSPCDEPCSPSSDPFCETIRDTTTCECTTTCNPPLTATSKSGKRKRLRCFPIA